MESGNAAREHIDAICQDRSPGPNKRNVEDLENALHLLSEELYSSDTHFLLELLQNADDNEYKASKPSFSLTLTDDALLTHSNETGFTRSNVEAICRIGKSSKVKLDGRRSIGEKGIGFKSVFKVASTVWISSRGYSFKFEKDRPLGMISPIWEELPQEQLSKGSSSEGGTFMRLQLSHDCDREQLRKEITSFDPNMLIFLRTLKEITLTIADSNGYSQRVLCGASEPNAIKILQNDKEIVNYVTFTYTVQDMPSEPKRQGITESDILLAFPVQDNQGQPAAHQVYAFLPIRNYGFNFLLQADFLLTSNREDITTSPWNETLHDSIPRAFAAAVKHLNRTSLRFTWPRCIPSSRELQAPFLYTSFWIEQELKASCVLESEDPSGCLKRPSSLNFVPESFTFEDPKDRMKKAMTLNETTRSKYLSQKYSHDHVQQLKRLGLLELDFLTFVEDLKVHLDRPEHNSKHQPKIWHSRLAELFIQQPIVPRYPESVFELQIIPLRGGRWISVNEAKGMLFFPSQDTRDPGLEDTPIMEIDPDALGSKARTELFRRLGAKLFNNQEICRAIQQHISLSSTSQLSIASLVSYVLFLFHHSSEAPSTAMWVVTETEQRLPASRVYSCQWHVGNKVLPVLHPNYIKRVDSEDREKWDHWLTDWLGIRRVPPLVDGSPDMFSLSRDMGLIRDNWASLDFLRLLRDNMGEYSKWLENDRGKSEDWAESSSKLKACLAETKVQCRGKSASVRLDETILLPREQGKWAELENHFPVLDVPDPGSSSWSFLRHFGVRNGTNPGLYLEILKTARDNKRSGDYTWVYEAIQDIPSQNARVIEQGFSTEPLIFIPATKFGQSQWATAKQCVWSGPDLLRRTPVLDRIYGSCKALFKRLLGVKGATTEILITEAKKIRDDDNIEYIAALFQAIDTFARRDENKQLNQQPEQLAEMVASLQECQIFPIELERYEDGAEGRHMLRSWTSEKTWFIADRPHLRKSLADAVLMIAFDIGQLDRMKWIQHLPGIEERLLSKAAFCRPKPGLKSVPDDPYTNLLRTRAKFISWLIPRSWSERDATVNRLKSAIVFGVERLEVMWVVRDGSDEHCSMPVPSRALVVRGDDGLHIYMNAQDIKSNSVPPEVAESLSACCNIREESITTLLVLTCKEENIQDELAWRGVYKPVEDDPYADFNEDGDGEDEQYNNEGSAGNTSHIEKPKVQPEEWPDPPNPQPRFITAEGPFKEVKVDESSLSPTDSRSNAQQTPEAEAVGDIPFQARRHKKNKNHGSELNDIFEGPSKPREEGSASPRTRTGPPEQGKEPSTASLARKNNGARSWRTLANSTTAGGIPPPPPKPSVRPPAKTLGEVVESFSQPANSVKIDDLAQLPYVHGMDNEFNLTGRANMIFVPDHQDLPQLTSTARSNPNGFRVLPACMQLAKDGDSTIFIARNKTGTDNHEQAFLGQVLVSNRLKELLGDRYTEKDHWTSPMRCRLTQEPFSSGKSKQATFTIPSPDGANLTEFLVWNSYKRAREWREECPNYHIEVHATASGRRSPLVMKTSVMEMARQYRLRHTYAPQNDVFILICIFDSQEEPKLRLYVDPWALYSAGRLRLTVKVDYPNFYHVLIDRGSGIKDPEWTGVARRNQGYTQPLRHLARGGGPARCPTPAAKSYVWEPLRHPKNTRLLCLEPGDGIDELRGELKEISLAPPVGFEYFAISYAWGSSLKQFSLWTPQGCIPLTASLYLGLKRLRRKEGKIWLWADAICINQEDREGDDEKARQIVLMTNIFQSAVRVYIWLGEDEDESHVAIQFLEEIAPIASAEVDGQVPKHSPNFPKVEDPKWSILAKLLERRWFRRVWVAQELVLAREAIVVCGARQMTWDTFHAAVDACFSVVEGDGYSFLLPRETKVAAVLHLGAFRRDYYSDRAERDDLLTLLERFHMAEATRQRDKLFALLSLAKDGKKYTPDYRKPLEDIITDFAGVLVKNGRAMDLLYRARGYSKQFPEFPSWIPNWISSPFPDTISRWPNRTHGKDFAAATSVDSDTEVIGSILYIDGYKLDSIKVLGECRSSINEIRSYLNEIFSKVDEVYSDLTNDERREIKCQLPIGNASKPSRGGNWHKGDRLASFLALMNYLERHKEVDKAETHKLLSLRRPDIPTVSNAHLRQLQPYMFTILDFAKLFSSAVVAVTKNQQFVGIVPATAQEGDLLVMFSGSKVPFLIRKVPKTSQFYYIGECYFHGIMYGEHGADSQSKDFQLR
ncbi:hypothetical protein CEP51_015025 [Fusarium floridanum]|uniref:Heterokaryon incompatibility domain-containing protein n=1 Tax=Fusarium floridanum TaxID=1325733 RepID=A0A428PHZ6_9HYPO|nr:hypothetical protein CEP51_015025 [Fusarium floridanum]